MGQKEEKKEKEKEEKKEKEKEEKKEEEEEEEKKLVHTDGGDQPKEVHEVLADLKIPLTKRTIGKSWQKNHMFRIQNQPQCAARDILIKTPDQQINIIQVSADHNVRVTSPLSSEALWFSSLLIAV